MDSLRLALEKLDGLRRAEIVSEEEFEAYRKRLIVHHKTLRQRHGSNRSSPAPSTCTTPCLPPVLPATPPHPESCALLSTPTLDNGMSLHRAPSSSGESEAFCPVPQRQLTFAQCSLCAEAPRTTPVPSPSISNSSSSSGNLLVQPGCFSYANATDGMQSWSPPPRSEVYGAERRMGTSGKFAVKLQPLPPAVTTADLVQAMSIFGLVVGAVVNTGNPNYGYVRFSEEASARAAHAAGGVVILGQEVWVRLSRWNAGAPNSEPQPSCFVGLFNLPYFTTVSYLYRLLERFPGFLNVRMMNRRGGAFAGHAFAQFQSIEEATVCRISLAGLTLAGQTVDVKFATRPQQMPSGSQ